jgi:hypothetical protein
VLHIHVAKVYRDIAHVVKAIHICFKYFICCRRIMQMFYLDVAKVDLMLHIYIYAYCKQTC